MVITTAMSRHQQWELLLGLLALQGDLRHGLASLVRRNRLTLLMLAASLAGAGSRACGAAVDTAAARWLARNAQALILFLQSLAILARCTGHAGYRAIQDSQRPFRRRLAPRLLRHRLDHRAAIRVDRATGMVRERPRFVVSLG